MKKLDNGQLEKLRHALQNLASRVRTDANAMLEQARSGSGGNGGSELSNTPFHLGDMGTEEYLYDLNNTLLANEQFIEVEAREALRRIDDGTFGRCESCQEPIAQERLEALPFTRFCVVCAEKEHSTPDVNLNDGRPMSPDDTLAPEGEMQEYSPKHVNPMEFPEPHLHRGDVHAVGTPGGGTSVGGLAGSNEGNGEPVISQVDEAMGSSYFDAEDDRVDDRTPRSGRSGGAVGGTPARKRAK